MKVTNEGSDGVLRATKSTVVDMVTADADFGGGGFDNADAAINYEGDFARRRGGGASPDGEGGDQDAAFVPLCIIRETRNRKQDSCDRFTFSTLPTILSRFTIRRMKFGKTFQAWAGFPKWNARDVKRFYPKGVKDEVNYYASQFNSVELNATFFIYFPPSQFKDWQDRTPADLKFFPKINTEISHIRRLKDAR